MLGASLLGPTLEESVGNHDEIGAFSNLLELGAERPAHQRIGRAAVAKMPGVVEIDHERQRAEPGQPHPMRDPWQNFLLDPDNIVFPRLDELTETLRIEVEARPIDGRRPSYSSRR
jgi:hypothetical protein